MTFLDVSRQVLPIAEKILLGKGALGGIALKNRTGLVAKTTKLEWKEMVTGAIKVNPTVACASGYFDGTDKNFSIPTNNIMIGDIISFQDVDGKAKGDLRIIITGITSSTVATARKIGGVDVAITVNDVAFVSTMAEAEGSVVSKRRMYEVPQTLFNYTQIIRAGHIIPGTDVSIMNYSTSDVKKELRAQAYDQFARLIDGIVASSARAAITLADGNTRRVAGGLNYFAGKLFNTSTGEEIGNSLKNIKVAGTPLNKDLINGAFKNIIDNGGQLNALVSNSDQLIVLAGLYQDKVNVQVINGTVSSTVGGAVNVIKSPINIGGNEITAIYLDTSMPKDEVIFFNLGSIEAIPLQGREVLEEIVEPSGKNDNYSIDILGEWTVKVKNAKNNTYILKDLTLPS